MGEIDQHRRLLEGVGAVQDDDTAHRVVTQRRGDGAADGVHVEERHRGTVDAQDVGDSDPDSHAESGIHQDVVGVTARGADTVGADAAGDGSAGGQDDDRRQCG
ncbi:hypothetical protein QE397_000775 [Rhodococcus sp. SORGH_AS 301]|nr:hypothetical protein [Rhodococcus sp. SORGH_AS_0301]